MKGHVLGFDGTSGAISAEDGSRYSFTKEQWRDERPPAQRDQVDFVAAGEEAREVYRVKAGASVSLPNADALNTEKVQAARSFVALRPQLPLAAVLLFASVFLNFMGSDSSDESCCVTLTGIHTVYSGIDKALDAQLEIAGMGQATTPGSLMLWGMNPERMAREEAERTKERESARDRIKTAKAVASGLTWLMYALWLIPLGAALIIYREIKNERRRGLELLLGVASLLTLLILPLTKLILGKGADGIIGYAMNLGAASLGYSFGAFVIGLAGLGLIGTALGRINHTPGL